MEKPKDFLERLVDLVGHDKQLHDAAVRTLNAYAESQEIKNARNLGRLSPEDRKLLHGPTT